MVNYVKYVAATILFSADRNVGDFFAEDFIVACSSSIVIIA